MVPSVSETRKLLGLVVPVYFDESVSRQTVTEILEGVFRDQPLFCARENAVVVVDRDTTAEEVLASASPDSPLHGWPIYRLARNRAKAGAVEEGLRFLLKTSDARFMVTRDCDGDHILDDIPRMVAMAADLERETGREQVAVMGARPSLEKPMGWVREEWEILTNKVLVDIIDFVLARSGKVCDKRFWSQAFPDIQSGYRVYSRGAAQMAVDSLAEVPEDRNIMTFACEFLPFIEGSLNGCVFGEVQRLTLVEQPVTSYSKVDLGTVYGTLLAYVGDRYGLERRTVLRMLDNHIGRSSLFFTDRREHLRHCRQMIVPDADAPKIPAFL